MKDITPKKVEGEPEFIKSKSSKEHKKDIFSSVIKMVLGIIRIRFTRRLKKASHPKLMLRQNSSHHQNSKERQRGMCTS